MTDLLNRYGRWLKSAGKAELTMHDRARIITAIETGLGHNLIELARMGRDGQDLIAGWLAERPSAATRRCYYSHLKATFDWLVMRGEIESSPMAGLQQARSPEYEPRPPSAEQWQRILLGAARPYWMWAVLAGGAGLRCCDIAQLLREDINEEKIYIRHSKGGKRRSVHTHPFVWRSVRDLPPGPIARHRDGHRVNPANLSRMCSIHFRRIGAPVTMHQLRHLFGTALYEQGTDLFVIQKEMGHASLDYTKIYARVGDRKGALAVTALPIFAAAS